MIHARKQPEAGRYIRHSTSPTLAGYGEGPVATKGRKIATGPYGGGVCARTPWWSVELFGGEPQVCRKVAIQGWGGVCALERF